MTTPINAARKDHWEGIYASKAPHEVSWFQHQSTQSLRLLMLAAPDRSAHIMDVGSGASTLLASLLDSGYTQITAVDISATALAKSQAQLGLRANQVQWLEADITQAQLPLASVDVWHDRAVFHFLTRTNDR